MSATIFGASQNNVWLVYTFGILLQLMVCYGHMALLFFKVGYETNCYQLLM